MQDVKSNSKSTTSTKEEKAGIKITKIIEKVQIIDFWMEFMEKLQSYTKLKYFLVNILEICLCLFYEFSILANFCA